MDIKCHFYKVILPVFMMVMVLLTGISCNSGGSSQPSESNESEMAETDFQEELVAVENDDSPTEEDIVREEQEQVVTDAAQVINNHFIALSQRDRQMLRNTVADVVTSYIGMSNVTPADIEKYMNSLHADGSQDIKYVIRHLIVNKEMALRPAIKCISLSHKSLARVIRQASIRLPDYRKLTMKARSPH